MFLVDGNNPQRTSQVSRAGARNFSGPALLLSGTTESGAKCVSVLSSTTSRAEMLSFHKLKIIWIVVHLLIAVFFNHSSARSLATAVYLSTNI